MEEQKMNKLLNSILLSKGLSEEQIAVLEAAGIMTKSDFQTIGDADTLMEIIEIDPERSQKLMNWAVGEPVSSRNEQNSKNEEAGLHTAGAIIVEGADVVKCVHCGTKQPKDYKTGDLCLSCGNQAEPVLNCHWCLSAGPGKFCRSCGSEFVASSDFEIALLLKREGESKNAIVNLVKNMSAQEKETMWAKIRKAR